MLNTLTLSAMTAMTSALRQHLPHSAMTDKQMSAYYQHHVAAITGAGSGIGRALATHLAKMGCEVALSDINTEALAETKGLLADYDVKVTTCMLDVSDNAAVIAWADEVMAAHSKVNFIFNNAGVALYSSVEGSSISELAWLIDINFWGVVYGTKAFLPLIKNSVKQSRNNNRIDNGHIINISSLFGLTAQPSQSAYNASKFAVRGFSESLRQELDIQRCGVSATCVHPGGIKTNIANSARGNESIADLGMGTGEKAVREFNKFLKFDANDAAWVILQATANDQPRCLIGNDAKIIDVVQRVFPSHYGTILHRTTKLAHKLKHRR